MSDQLPRAYALLCVSYPSEADCFQGFKPGVQRILASLAPAFFAQYRLQRAITGVPGGLIQPFDRLLGCFVGQAGQAPPLHRRDGSASATALAIRRQPVKEFRA